MKPTINVSRFQKRQELNRLIGKLPDWAIDVIIKIINDILLSKATVPSWEEVKEISYE